MLSEVFFFEEYDGYDDMMSFSIIFYTRETFLLYIKVCENTHHVIIHIISLQSEPTPTTANGGMVKHKKTMLLYSNWIEGKKGYLEDFGGGGLDAETVVGAFSYEPEDAVLRVGDDQLTAFLQE